jgi:hypothetical protein
MPDSGALGLVERVLVHLAQAPRPAECAWSVIAFSMFQEAFPICSIAKRLILRLVPTVLLLLLNCCIGQRV